MKLTPLFLALALLLPGYAVADEVLPPPKVDIESMPDEVPPERDANLRDELQVDKDANVDVRSYQRDGAVITEYAVHGRVFKVKVQPAGGAPAYYLYDANGDGNFERLPGGAKRIVPPTWVLKEF